jgi:hypothetical protein
MTTATRLRSIARLLAMVMLAYGLALSGLLGAISAGAHVNEARTAAQLGVICTIHGIGNTSGGTEDPTPGRLACVEHCVLAAAGGKPFVPTADPASAQPAFSADAHLRPNMGEGRRIAPVAAPPLPRGPPAFI